MLATLVSSLRQPTRTKSMALMNVRPIAFSRSPRTLTLCLDIDIVTRDFKIILDNVSVALVVYYPLLNHL